MQDVGINVGTVRPDDGAKFLIDTHRREHFIVVTDVLEDGPPEQWAQVHFPCCAVGEAEPHPTLA